MKVVVLGADGYIGTEFIYRHQYDYDIIAVDSYFKRELLYEEGIFPLYNVPLMVERGWKCKIRHIDICDYDAISKLIMIERPDAILHLGEQPSAPWSMRSPSDGVRTIDNNLTGTLNVMFSILQYSPDTHLIKIGSMGEYGTPNVEIPEGWFDLEYKGRKDRLLFPKNPHSVYHLSKVFDSDALAFACKNWGLKVTDLNQGFVYGATPEYKSRYCYDAIFGTSLNRFVVQAATGHPITVYGKGGQTRGLIHISDSVQCLNLAIKNPAQRGQFIVANQLTEWKSINEIANLTVEAANSLGIEATIGPVENPRSEKEEHFYEVEHKVMESYGFKPTYLSKELLEEQIKLSVKYKSNVNLEHIHPTIKWK